MHRKGQELQKFLPEESELVPFDRNNDLPLKIVGPAPAMALTARCATYVLVEPDRLKIGHSSAIARRAREIAPFVNWDLSLATIFTSVQEATNCERALHWVFRLYRLKGARGGDTEYFMRDCLPKLDAFLCEHGGDEIKRGEDLRQWLVPGDGCCRA